jgi:hypothetical protein
MGGDAREGAVELSFTYTEEEYTSAARSFYRRTTDTKFTWYLGFGVFVAAMLIVALAGDPYLGGFLLGAGLFGLAARYYTERVQPGRLFRSNPKFREEYRLTFSEEGVHFRSKGVESKLAWDFYSKVWETRDFYFLVYDVEMFSLVPKRVFRGPSQEFAFRELLRRKLGHGAEAAAAVPPGVAGRRLEGEYVPPAEPPDWR